jgi:hypothetical protein
MVSEPLNANRDRILGQQPKDAHTGRERSNRRGHKRIYTNVDELDDPPIGAKDPEGSVFSVDEVYRRLHDPAKRRTKFKSRRNRDNRRKQSTVPVAPHRVIIPR